MEGKILLYLKHNFFSSSPPLHLLLFTTSSSSAPCPHHPQVHMKSWAKFNKQLGSIVGAKPPWRNDLLRSFRILPVVGLLRVNNNQKFPTRNQIIVGIAVGQK